MNALLSTLAFLVGALMPAQAAINASLRVLLKDPLMAGIANFVCGGIGVVLIAVLFRAPFPGAATLASFPAWGWLGGLIGAAVVVVSLMAAPKLGAGTLFVLIVAGQILASLVFDHFGLMGYAVRPAGLMRVIGAMMLIGGVVLIVRH